jgi:hypothetical protein
MLKHSTKNKKIRYDLKMFCPACFEVGLKIKWEQGIFPEYARQKYTIEQLDAHLSNRHSLEELIKATLDYAFFFLEGGGTKEVI